MSGRGMGGAAKGGIAAEARLDDIRMARVHLRLGELTLARAELEDLVRRDALDANGLAALAEARWRTGDTDAAADAAVAHLSAGGSDDVALCIAAEAAALDGRSDDARALMDRLPHADAATLDAIFAGMPRRAPWPTAPVERTDAEALRREAAVGRTDVGHGAPSTMRSAPGGPSAGDAAAEPAYPIADGAPPRPTARPARRIKAQLDPLAELARARDELESRPERAFLRLALVLRHDPTLAPAVLEALHLRREPGAALLRGDAQRLLGRHLEAEAAFDAAAETLQAS